MTKSVPEKAKLLPGFEPGLLGQNATALQLAPPPRPRILNSYSIVVLKEYLGPYSELAKGS